MFKENEKAKAQVMVHPRGYKHFKKSEIRWSKQMENVSKLGFEFEQQWGIQRTK